MDPQCKQRGAFGTRFLSITGGVLLLLIFVAYFFYNLEPIALGKQGGNNVPATTSQAQSVTFSVIKNEGFKDIAAHLSQQSIIKSITVFKLYALVSGKAQRFQPGVYELSPTMSVPKIVSLLTEGGKNEATITIPEGSTIREVEQLLVQANVVSEKAITRLPITDFTDQHPYLLQKTTLEGFLFPDTYRFQFHTDPKDVVEKMLANFESKAWPLVKDNPQWYTTLILASILEREVREPRDRELVAGILLKRIRIGMPLQVDATVDYGTCNGIFQGCKKDGSASVSGTFASYNTYTHQGWPPSPIANPGSETLRAALHPVSSPYLYYLSRRDTGETLFSKTFQEHTAKRAQYL